MRHKPGSGSLGSIGITRSPRVGSVRVDRTRGLDALTSRMVGAYSQSVDRVGRSKVKTVWKRSLAGEAVHVAVTGETGAATATRHGHGAAPYRRSGYCATSAGAVSVGSRLFGVTRVLVAALVVALAGCGSDDDGSPEPTTVSPTVPTPSPASASPVPVDPASEAVAAYEAMWEAYDEAARDPQSDPEEAGLERYATGDALAMLTDLLASLRADGLVAQGSIDHAPEVTEMSPEQAPTRVRVEDCADSSDRSVARADGGLFEDEPGGLRLIFADADKEEGVWKVAALGIGRVGSCQR